MNEARSSESPEKNMHIVHAAATETGYSLTVFLPASYLDGDAMHPVLFALDGDASFDDIAAQTRNDLRKTDLIVVGIGFGVDLPERRTRRLRDYTPEPVPGLDGTGGGAAFLRAVQEDIIPFIDATYRIDPARRTFAGHSLGGFFALYALFEEPTRFSRYIVVSPSVSIDDFAQARTRFQIPVDHEVSLHIAIGGDENPARLIQPVEQFVEALRSDGFERFDLSTAVIENEDHFSVVQPALEWFLQNSAR